MSNGKQSGNEKDDHDHAGKRTIRQLQFCKRYGELRTERKDSTACETSAWLDQEIKLLKTINTTARLTHYTHQGRAVFEGRTCLLCADTMTTIYTCEGDEICKFGGIAGFNTRPDFYETATDKMVIWHN